MDTCNIMKAIPITYNGINFRSKLEARHYIFMKKIGWNVEYEPEVEGVFGYQPDFAVFTDGNCYGQDKLYVEVKPISSQAQFYGEDYKNFRDKVHRSGILKKGSLLIVGNNLKLRDVKGHYNEGKIYVYGIRMLKENEISDQERRNYSLCSFSGCPEGDYEGIGLKESWNDARSDLIKTRRDEKCFYDVIDHNLCEEFFSDSTNIKASKFIEKSWNGAWSSLQWRGVDF